MVKISYAFIVSVALTFAPEVGAFQAPKGDFTADGYRIQAGALDDALNAFAAQSRVQILYSPSLVANRRSSGLNAHVSARDALARLLQGTGLTAVAVNANTYLLQVVPRPRPVAAPRATVRRDTSGPGSPTQLDTVHVTGTRIPRSAFQTSTPLTIITREQIRSSGHQTLFDLLRLMPGMTGHHPRDVATASGASQVPSAAAASSSLYSLGPRATLFLVDGRRIANYGLVSTDMGALSDLNGIPLSMIDRIEILHGGASAIYGADAMAGVVNIILKKDYSGGEITANFGVSERGDAEQQRLSVNLGLQTRGGGNVFLSADHFTRNPLVGSQRMWSTLDQEDNGLQDARIPFGYYFGNYYIPIKGCEDLDTGSEGQTCSLDRARYVSLQPGITSNAFYGHYRQPVGSNSEIYADVRATRVVLEMQNAPFFGLVNLPDDSPDAFAPMPVLPLAYAFSEVGPVRNRTTTTTRDSTLGFRGYRGRWEWDLSLAQRRNKVLNRIDGLIDEPKLEEAVEAEKFSFTKKGNTEEVIEEISPQNTLGGEVILDSVVANFDGPVFAMPGGDATVAIGAEARRERLRSRPGGAFMRGEVALAQKMDARNSHRYDSALYTEMNLPLHDSLSIDAAWRVDHNGGYGSRVSPKVGFKWSPLQSLTLRGSVGEGYRAPTLFEMRRPMTFGDTAIVPWNSVTDPCLIQLSETACQVDKHATVNSKLKPETSHSRTLGMIWSPTDAFSLSLNHYRIRRNNEILVINSLQRPELYPEALVRDSDGYLIGVNMYLDNVGSTDVRGWEFDADYRFETARLGKFALRLNGHYLDHLIRRSHPKVDALDYAGYTTPNRSALGSVQWSYRNWITTLNLRYMGPAKVDFGDPTKSCYKTWRVSGKCRTPSATVTDLNIAYGGFEHWLLSLNVSNLSDHTPVNYDESPGGYSIADDDPVGRYYLVSATYRF
ncbi:TonB-dependent receptor domain-containing protein [Lysobacter sp. CA196]|uniref:TonB-dependent receptor domain-containing protein n=1 Tax=Lysobacter sp. CA196 TaxID=3455606 RepID=UPI003F8D4B2D